MNALAAFDARVDGLLAGLAPAARRQLAGEMARQLRTSQSRRIAAQQGPDGDAYAPRKPQPRLRDRKGRLRRTMFAKLRTPKWLKTDATAGAAIVEFAAGVQRIAQVHQFGLRDRVSRRGGPEIDYPARALLGLTAAEIAAIEDVVLAHLAAR